MTAIDTWIAELSAGRYSDSPQNLISDVDTAIAALALIAALGPIGGPQAANVVLAGPTSGGPANPTFRALVAADFAVTLLLSIGSINLNSATRPANGVYLPGAGVPAASASSTDIFQWSTSGLAMLAGAIIPRSTNGIVGTTTNDNANAGSIGEFVEGVVTTVAPTTVTASGASQDLATIALTAGDWDLEGLLITVPAAGTTTTAIIAGFSTAANTLPAGERRSVLAAPPPASVSQSVVVPRLRMSLAAPATARLVANISFAVSTMQMAGYLNARRVR